MAKFKYISVDIEASGPTPANYSMLSFGACIVGEYDKTFYRELKPISRKFVLEAMQVGCRGLHVGERLPDPRRCDPDDESFDPMTVLKALEEHGQDPKQAMSECCDWIIENTKGYQPVLVASPVVFDGGYLYYYFDLAGLENPFGYGGKDINSIYQGTKKNLYSSISDLLPAGITHNALQDAIDQGKVFERIIRDF
jgi:hypothetical protein